LTWLAFFLDTQPQSHDHRLVALRRGVLQAGKRQCQGKCGGKRGIRRHKNCVRISL